MLSESDIAQLCFGRIVYAEVYNSSGTDAAGAHWAVMLDSNEEIQNNDVYFVAPISNNKTIDSEFLVPVPRRTGRKGYVICSWLPEVHLAGIQRIGAALADAEMLTVLEMIAKYRASKK